MGGILITKTKNKYIPFRANPIIIKLKIIKIKFILSETDLRYRLIYFAQSLP